MEQTLPDPKYRWMRERNRGDEAREATTFWAGACEQLGSVPHHADDIPARFGTLSIPSQWANDSAPTRLPSLQGNFRATFHCCQGLPTLDFIPFTTINLEIEHVDIPHTLCASVGHSTKFALKKLGNHIHARKFWFFQSCSCTSFVEHSKFIKK